MEHRQPFHRLALGDTPEAPGAGAIAEEHGAGEVRDDAEDEHLAATPERGELLPRERRLERLDAGGKEAGDDEDTKR